jgi:hypothetical protein
MPAARRRRLLGPLLAVATVVAGLSLSPHRPAAIEPLPARLSDTDFWALSESLSEPGGSFRSENLVSNEHTYQYVIPALKRTVAPGGVYLGVAPDQNFTYIAATEPRMAFILDIRRGNLLLHLMYKAIFELSADRAEFLSRLFAKVRPAGLGPRSTVTELFTAYARVQMTDEVYREQYRANVADIRRHLLKTRGLPISDDDWRQLEGIYFAFFYEGPSLRYSTSTAGGSRFGFNSNFPTFEEMAMQTDWEGQPRGFLASEEAFRVVKQLHARNLIVPVVGNFAGPKALRAIGQYLRRHGATVSMFYVSNVEQYLFQDQLFPAFAQNVATLPIDDNSVFIRSVSMRFGYRGLQLWSDGRGSALDPIGGFLRDFHAGRLRGYQDVNARSRQ